MKPRKPRPTEGIGALSWAMVDTIDVARGRTVRIVNEQARTVVGRLAQKGYVRWVSSHQKAYIATEEGKRAVAALLCAKGRAAL